MTLTLVSFPPLWVWVELINITPATILCYMAKERLCWVVLHNLLTSSGDSFKSIAFFPGGHRGKNQWDLPERRQTAVLWSPHGEKWAPGADSNLQMTARENIGLSLTSSQSRNQPKPWMCSEVDSSPRASRKERSLAHNWISADPEQGIQPRCAETSDLQNCEPINVISLWRFVMQQ